ncbi:MAG: phosphate acetyltransferase [Planctomycetota bacterium]|jgi:phosphate acetyltransferase
MDSTVTRKIVARAQELGKCIVLPEGTGRRVIQAARRATDMNYARIILLGEPEQVNQLARELDVQLDGIEIVNHLVDESKDQYVENLLERRRKKGMSTQDAGQLLENPVYYGGMMVGSGRVDGMVAGSLRPTRDVVRSAIYCVGLAEGNKTVTACSIMNTNVPEVGVDGSLLFADTGVVPEPTAEQLADIAVAAANATEALLAVEPCVAMLSFSTNSSAHSPAVQKVVEATKIVRQRRSDLKIDGELQLDAAIIPGVAERKAPDSIVAGKANTLIFPDLSSGNIGYKLVERLGGATALGPLLLGLARPINDLSRGCKVRDIALITAITAVQAG